MLNLSIQQRKVCKKSVRRKLARFNFVEKQLTQGGRIHYYNKT
jgi:hypothetical protein